MDSSRAEVQVAPTAWNSFTTRSRPRYWFCIVVHALVVLLRLAMVLVWAFRLDHKCTFNINHLSIYTAITNFITTVYVTSLQWLTVSALNIFPST
jgi:hypothetical protein